MSAARREMRRDSDSGCAGYLGNEQEQIGKLGISKSEKRTCA